MFEELKHLFIPREGIETVVKGAAIIGILGYGAVRLWVYSKRWWRKK